MPCVSPQTQGTGWNYVLWPFQLIVALQRSYQCNLAPSESHTATLVTHIQQVSAGGSVLLFPPTYQQHQVKQSEPRGVYTRLVCYQPFCMEANVGHLSGATLRDWIVFTIGVLELF